MVNLGINSIFMARNGVVELIPVLEELSHLCESLIRNGIFLTHLNCLQWCSLGPFSRVERKALRGKDGEEGASTEVAGIIYLAAGELHAT